MASTTTTADLASPAAHSGDDNYLTHDKGLASWLLTLDHKRIGIMYFCCVIAAFALGGLFAILIRTELWAPGKTIVDADTYNQLFPLHLGAKDVAFPKLNLMSWYMWVTGACFLISSLIVSAADTGWTFYTPYSTTTPTAVIPALAGVFILGFSSIIT